MTLESIKKAGYVAVGAPVAAMKSMNAHFDAIRTALRDLSDRMGDDLSAEFDNWVEEGRTLVSRVTERAGEESEDARASAREVRNRVAGAVDDMRTTAGDAATTAKATLTEPPVDLTAIDGIGPAYATRLREAGVVTTNALMARTATRDGIERLAAATGLGVEQLRAWAADADLTTISGVGADYQTLLQLSGVGSISELAEKTAAALLSTMKEQNDTFSIVDQLPSLRTVTGWIRAAR